uniref:ATP-dependent Clp protease proteolytic subunit n=1 Tax=Havardia acatlensis TaxID=3089646 RepID=A0A6H0EMG3_9FABA|nr:ClpP [Havardia acatlensis]QIT02719.1 ClpP [Havardia acatlensis]
MPVGIPKVPFINSHGHGDDEGSWFDLNRLYRQRSLFLGQKLDSETSNHICGLIIYLSMDDPTRDLHLFINCPGGWMLPAIALHDMMEEMPPDVHTICIGLAASIGSFILASGEITKRTAFPHARVVMHQPVCDIYNKSGSGEFIMEINEITKLRDSLIQLYAKKTNRPTWVISEDLDRDAVFTVEQAQAHGIIDEIGRGIL